MRALVFVRRCVDHTVAIRLKADGSDVETSGVKMSINPFDEIACEEAVRLKEQGAVSEIIVLGMGATQTQDTIRHALAMGADRGMFIEGPSHIAPLDKARAIAHVAREHTIDLILLGKQAIDDDYGHEPVMAATLLGWDVVTDAARVDLAKNEVERETDTGTETKSIALPAIISADLRLNTPRVVKLPQVIEARKKPLDTITLPFAFTDHAQTLAVKLPEPRPPVVMLNSVDDVFEKIKEALA